MGSYVVFLIGSDAAASITNVKMGALLLHFSNKFVVHFYFFIYRLFLLALFQTLALVQVKPGILFYLFEAVSECWLRHENVLD